MCIRLHHMVRMQNIRISLRTVSRCAARALWPSSDLWPAVVCAISIGCVAFDDSDFGRCRLQVANHGVRRWLKLRGARFDHWQGEDDANDFVAGSKYWRGTDKWVKNYNSNFIKFLTSIEEIFQSRVVCSRAILFFLLKFEQQFITSIVFFPLRFYIKTKQE